MRLRISVLVFGVMLFHCGNDLPTLHGIDSEKWKQDKNACQGYRQSIEPSLRAELSKLKGLGEMDVIEILGRPDENELYKRNQKFFYYFVSPGPTCTTAATPVHKLVLRFNAMGYAQLVSLEED